MAQWRKVIVSGSSAVLNQISASGNIVPTSDNGVDLGSSTLEFKDLYIDGTAYLDSATITAGTITGLDTDLVVADGGTGAGTFTDGGVLLGSGTDAITAMSVLGDSEMIVGDGSGDPVAESGATLRTSIGVGTGDSPQFTAVNVGAASDTTLARSSAGVLAVEGNVMYHAGGTDVVVADGGTGASTLTDGGILLGSGTGAVTAMSVLADGEFVVGDGTTDPVAESGDTARISLGVGSTSTWQITGLNIGAASDTTLTRVSAGDLQIESNIIYRAGGTDVAVTDGGTGASSLNNLITLGTHTTGNYVATLTAGALIDLQNNSGETASPTVDVDLTEAGEAAIANGDYILFLDGGATGTHAKEAIADVATLFAGDGLQAASSVMAVDVSDFAGTGLEDDSSENLRLATQGTGISGGNGSTLSITPAQTAITSIRNTSLQVGTAASQEFIDFGTANEVNTKVNDTERLSVTATGVDITGVATVSSNLTVGGNLDVNGTLTTIDTANSYVADKFMIIASGSTSATDGGIIVQGDDTAGYALGYDSGTSRWVLDNNLAHNATDITPDAYVGTVELGTTDGDSQSAPTYGSGVGSIYVDTDDSEIWIYA